MSAAGKIAALAVGDPDSGPAAQTFRIRQDASQDIPVVGMPLGTVRFVCNLESAAGVWRAANIARAHPRVLALAFGAGDFVRDVNLVVGAEALETLYARSRLVLAARLAGIRAPIDGVYSKVDDLEGLERTTRQGRAVSVFPRAGREDAHAAGAVQLPDDGA